MKARAESQRETRDRIARATAELHEEKGVAQTTVAEIARRARDRIAASDNPGVVTSQRRRVPALRS